MISRPFPRLSVIVLAAAVVSLYPLRASAGDDDSKKLNVSIVEDFWFFGCPDGIDPSLVDTCGTAKASRFGQAVVGTVITAFAPLPSGCFLDEHTTTIQFKRGSLVVDIAGTLCPTGGPNFELTGQYTVTGGTGEFDGASGSGAVWAARNDGPIDSELDGTITVPSGDER